MARLFRDLSLGASKRELTTAASLSKSAYMPIDPLSTPFEDLSPSANLTAADLRLIAYDIFVAACRTYAGKPLAFIPSSPSVADSSSTSSTLSPSSVSSQRSLTSTAASKMKKVLGLRSSTPGSKNGASPGSKSKKAATIGELVRVQMRVSEAADSRVRRGLLRVSAGQVCAKLDQK